MQAQSSLRSSNPSLPGSQRGFSNYFNRAPASPNLGDTYPPPNDNRPRPAPRPPRMQPSPPKPQQRQTPSPPANRPSSGSNRDNLLSPPSSDQARPDSSGRPPGIHLHTAVMLLRNHLLHYFWVKQYSPSLKAQNANLKDYQSFSDSFNDSTNLKWSFSGHYCRNPYYSMCIYCVA